MSLMAGIRRCEARLEWLDDKGPVRLCEIKLKWLEVREKVEATLARDPGNEIMRECGASMGVKLPPLPKPVMRPAPVPSAPAPSLSPPASPRPPPDERVRDSSFADVAFAEVVRVPPPSWPPPPVEWETHDIPEHMQIRPVQWRRRGPQDDDDWEDGGRDFGQCLTDYDPLAEEDES